MTTGLISLVLAANAWVATENQIIRPDAVPGTGRSITLSAAKNEFASFQIAITGPAAGVTGAWGIPGIPAEHVHVFREEMINLARKSGPDGWTGRTPDGLIPCGKDDVVGEDRNGCPFDVAAGETRALWVDIHVPEDAQPGDKRGIFTIKTSDEMFTIEVIVRVRNFAIPSSASLRSFFGMSWGAVKGDTALRHRFAQLGLDHRISISGFDDGNNSPDHIAQAYGDLMNGKAPTLLKGAKLTSLMVVGDDKAGFWKMVVANGWRFRTFDYTCDEPPATCQWADIPVRIAALKSIDPNYKSLVTMNIEDAVAHVADAVDIMVPVINQLNDKPPALGGWDPTRVGGQRDKYSGWLGGNGLRELWTYESCMSHSCGGAGTDPYWSGWPSYSIDAAPMRRRALQWLAWSFRLTGELYWETNWATAVGLNPWADQWAFNGNGDGTFFYVGDPAKIGGQTKIPLASIRLKILRQGYQDYEYLKLLDAKGDKSGWEAAARMFPNPWTQSSVADFEKTRLALADTLDKLYAPPEPPPAPDAGPVDPVQPPDAGPVTPDAGPPDAGPVTPPPSPQRRCGGLALLWSLFALFFFRRVTS